MQAAGTFELVQRFQLLLADCDISLFGVAPGDAQHTVRQRLQAGAGAAMHDAACKLIEAGFWLSMGRGAG
jgi:hypothetical protein